MDCPFCGDVEIRERGRLVSSNDSAFCLVNFEPIKPGHVMVIPRRHVVRVSELTPIESHAIHSLVDRMVDAIEQLYPDEPPAIRVNHGRHKTVPHLHYHIIPAKGSLRDHFTAHEGLPLRVRKTDAELMHIAQQLREAMLH